MSVKPTIIPQWATNALATVEPPLLKKQSGFVAGERPPARHLNWLLNNLYLWAEYLRDGSFSGNATFGDNLTVNGATQTAQLTATGLITANQGVTAAAGQHMTVGGIGLYKHGSRQLVVSAGQAIYDTGAGVTSTWNPVTGARTFSGACTSYLPIPVLPGFQIDSVQADYNVAGVGSVQPIWRRINPIAGTNVIGSSGAVDTTGSVRESQTYSPGIILGANEQYFVSFTVTNAANIIYGALVTYSQP